MRNEFGNGLTGYLNVWARDIIQDVLQNLVPELSNLFGNDGDYYSRHLNVYYLIISYWMGKYNKSEQNLSELQQELKGYITLLIISGW